MFKAMYHDVQTFWALGNELFFLFLVYCGVIQGCPTSGALFNYSIDPLLYIFSRLVVVPRLGLVLACADDVAAAMRALKDLEHLYSIFHLFDEISGLRLSASKCVIILTSVEASPHNIHIIRNWLRTRIPAWENINISDNGKYLGFFLGPRSESLNWSEPINKYDNVPNNF